MVPSLPLDFYLFIFSVKRILQSSHGSCTNSLIETFSFFQACVTALHFNFSFTPSVFPAMRAAQYCLAGMAERVIYSLPGQFPAG